jgi:hypothetical protein
VVRGNEEYVHLKSLEDEFHYTESNMPTMTGEDGKEGVEDREEYQRVESPRKSPITAAGENENNCEERKQTEGEEREEELERRGKEEQEQDEGGDNMRFSETPHSPMMSQPFTSSLHSRGKYFDEADYQNQFADSPGQQDYFSQLRSEEDGKEETKEGKDYKEQAEDGNNITNDNNQEQNDYDQHVLLQEPLSIPKRSSSAEQKRRDEEELARPPPQLLSTGSFSKTTMSQRSSYESLHEID